MTRMMCSAASLAVFAFVSGPAMAVPMTLCGDTVCYEFDPDQPAIDLLGIPNLDGDNLEFNIPQMRAESANGAGQDVATANFVARVYSIGEANIVTISVAELIDYNIVNAGEISTDNAEVSAELRLSVVNRTGDGTTTELYTFGDVGESGGQQVVDLVGAVAPDFASGDVDLSVQNVLTAFTDELGELAWIQKKFSIVTSVIPVPAAVWLFASGLGFLGFVRRRMAR